MTAFQYDRAMALHRRAYACQTLAEWVELAHRLEFNVSWDVLFQFWKTAQLAKEADIPAKVAFPYVQ